MSYAVENGKGCDHGIYQVDPREDSGFIAHGEEGHETSTDHARCRRWYLLAAAGKHQSDICVVVTEGEAR